MLLRSLCVEYQSPTRHALEVSGQELHHHGSRRQVLRIGHQRRRANPLDPAIKRDDGVGGDIERAGHDGRHLLPGLADRVVDMVDWVRGPGMVEDEVGADAGVVIDGDPLEHAVEVGPGAEVLRGLDEEGKVLGGVPEAALGGAGDPARANNHGAKEARVLVEGLVQHTLAHPLGLGVAAGNRGLEGNAALENAGQPGMTDDIDGRDELKADLSAVAGDGCFPCQVQQVSHALKLRLKAGDWPCSAHGPGVVHNVCDALHKPSVLMRR